MFDIDLSCLILKVRMIALNFDLFSIFSYWNDNTTTVYG